jgi:hypothetical protein
MKTAREERMQGGTYGRKYTVKPRFYVILAVLLLLVVWGFAALLGAFSPARVEWGRLSSDQAISAIVLRDEQVVSAEEYGRLSCIAAESEAVAKGAPVATLFLSGYSEKDSSSLLKLQNDIKDYQKNHVIKDTVYKDLDAINAKIDDKMNEISSKVIAHRTQDLATAEQDLRNDMDERKAYMYSIIDKPDDELSRMYQQEVTLQEKINLTMKAVNAPADGLVSFYLDGYETTLTLDGISGMTPAEVKELRGKLLGFSQPFTSADLVNAGQPICRLVNPEKWYAVVVMNAGEDRFVAGTDCDVTFDGLPETVTAKVLKEEKEGGAAFAVLEVPKGAREMISLRLVGGHLGQDIEGFRVPLGMVLEENGKAYVAIKEAGAEATRLEVRILGKDDKYAIIKEATDEGALQIGQELTRP